MGSDLDDSHEGIDCALFNVHVCRDAITMRFLFSETAMAICSMRQTQSFIQSRQEKVFTPHHALIDTELFALVINPVP
jgi:hypothetical protein